ncbi:MAG: hypothetical protein WCP01_05345 [Methylococcaceae bacterium]
MGGIPVWHEKAEQFFEVFLKLEVFTLLVICLEVTRFEYKSMNMFFIGQPDE